MMQVKMIPVLGILVLLVILSGCREMIVPEVGQDTVRSHETPLSHLERDIWGSGGVLEDDSGAGGTPVRRPFVFSQTAEGLEGDLAIDTLAHPEPSFENELILQMVTPNSWATQDITVRYAPFDPGNSFETLRMELTVTRYDGVAYEFNGIISPEETLSFPVFNSLSLPGFNYVYQVRFEVYPLLNDEEPVAFYYWDYAVDHEHATIFGEN